MKFVTTPLPGVSVVDMERVYDERGFFTRVYDADAFPLMPHIAQASISFNPHRGTVRGLHYQQEPFAEAKLVRCTRGAIFDVVVDLATRRWFGVELTQDGARMLFVPEGYAHGFQSLADDSEVTYLILQSYRPDAQRGVRWNDPAFAVDWPLDVTTISDRDRAFPDFAS
ncbi:MAG TPA: dTDP-4-dehydrorhamnose 3,5-epimerase family protein [Thermoanaerobaculia bacterium]|nr:dTDP-4-dehydrorhamnose 3,5-epimerase family protein [Thermoanaerobaculia bacterium]